jgi:hypothetical protein
MTPLDSVRRIVTARECYVSVLRPELLQRLELWVSGFPASGQMLLVARLGQKTAEAWLLEEFDLDGGWGEASRLAVERALALVRELVPREYHVAFRPGRRRYPLKLPRRAAASRENS